LGTGLYKQLESLFLAYTIFPLKPKTTAIIKSVTLKLHHKHNPVFFYVKFESEPYKHEKLWSYTSNGKMSLAEP
jgi:hypothetical protein